MDSFSARDVRRELARLREAVPGDYRERKGKTALDSFANSLRFEGATISCEDAIEREEVLAELSAFGNDSYARYLYGD